MALVPATVSQVGNTVTYSGGTGVSDNDIVVQTSDVSQWDTFMLQSTAGAMDVAVSLDGTNYSTAPLSLQDMGSTSTAPVIVTAANRTYGFRGKFSKIQVSQNGATAVTGATLVCAKI